MSIVLVCGTEYARLDYVQSLLELAGVSNAIASKRDGMTPQQFSDKLLTLNKVDQKKPRVIKQLPIGKAWENVATDLVLSNIEAGDWGWSDANLVYFLDFWKEFDPFTKFVIVYSSPERTVNAIIESGVHEEADIEACLLKWRRHNTEYLRFYKNNKSRCILVDIEEVEKNGLSLIGLANEREIAELETEIDAPVVEVEEPSSLVQLVTASFVGSDEALQSLSSDIARFSDLASSEAEGAQGNDDVDRQHNMIPFMDSGLNSGPSRTLALELLKQFQEMRQRDLAKQAELAELKEKAEQLEDMSSIAMEQLHVAQEELEDTIQELGLTKTEALELKKASEQIRKENAQLKSDAAKLQRMTATLTAEKNKLAENVDALTKTAANLTKEQSVIASERDNLTSERDKLTSFNKELSLERDKLVGENKALSGERDKLAGANQALAGERDKLAGANKSLASERDKFASQNKDLSAQLSGLNSKIDSVTKEKDKLAQESAKAKAEIARISGQLSNARSGSNEVVQLQAELDKSAKESELMLQQLHQVQSELEIYFNKYMELSSTGNTVAPSAGSDKAETDAPTPAAKDNSDAPKEVSIDFREFVEGENWYYAEHDGRWAGPEEESTLNIKSLSPGTYDIMFDVVDAMSPSIIANMKVFFDDEPVSLKWRGKYATTIKPLRRLLKNKVTYPLEMSGKVVVGAYGNSETSQIKFVFPETISPLIHGGTDRRKLGIRMLSVRMKKV